MVRVLGAIYTPPDIAEFLVNWAITSPTTRVLDLGVGEGAFVFQAYRQLLHLGADSKSAQQQIFGAEIDEKSFQKFVTIASQINLNFSQLKNADFFETTFPMVDSVVGNPPYVRRSNISNAARIRKTILDNGSDLIASRLHGLSDLYIYFLLLSFKALKPGGRLAVIVADSWLNADYGRELKRKLIEDFNVSQLISVDRALFEDAEVKPVMILATKKSATKETTSVDFVRLRNGVSMNLLGTCLNSSGTHHDILIHRVDRTTIEALHPWGAYFKAPDVYAELSQNPLFSPISNIAVTRIGIQTLAKEFFVLDRQRIDKAGLEEDFLEPLAYSPRCFSRPIIEVNQTPNLHLFYCSEAKTGLEGTMALEYIEFGESIDVTIRGKGLKVRGYNNKDRILRANRPVWYDLKTAIVKRGRAPILIPRLIYESFVALWNQANFVPGELFIEFFPQEASIELPVYLAILNSSIAELAIRSQSQLYGGGAYNISPGKIGKIFILDATKLDQRQKRQLNKAYQIFVYSDTNDRFAIDLIVYHIIGFDAIQRYKVEQSLRELRELSTSSKKYRNMDELLDSKG